MGLTLQSSHPDEQQGRGTYRTTHGRDWHPTSPWVRGWKGHGPTAFKMTAELSVISSKRPGCQSELVLYHPWLEHGSVPTLTSLSFLSYATLHVTSRSFQGLLLSKWEQNHKPTPAFSSPSISATAPPATTVGGGGVRISTVEGFLFLVTHRSRVLPEARAQPSQFGLASSCDHSF